jgi:hypothetical protein
MTTYAGDTIEITNSGTDWDGSVLTPVKIAQVTVTVMDGAATPNTWVNAATMVYDPIRQLWVYLWNTNYATPVPAGNYTAKVIMIGVDSTEVFEFVKIKLKAPTF